MHCPDASTDCHACVPYTEYNATDAYFHAYPKPSDNETLRAQAQNPQTQDSKPLHLIHLKPLHLIHLKSLGWVLHPT